MSSDKETEEIEKIEEIEQENEAIKKWLTKTYTQLETDKNAKYLTEEERDQLGVGRGDFSFSSPIAYLRR